MDPQRRSTTTSGDGDARHLGRLFEALVEASPGECQLLDSSTAKAHRSAAGGKGGRLRKRLADHERAARRKSTLLSMPPADPSPSR
jgi:hypothetical protein